MRGAISVHHGSTLLSFFVVSVSPSCIQIHRGRRPGVAPGPLRYRHSFRFTPLLAGLLVGTCGGIPGGRLARSLKPGAAPTFIYGPNSCFVDYRTNVRYTLDRG